MKNDYPRRKLPRLQNYDYSSNGYYFVTINISDPGIRLSVISGDVNSREFLLGMPGAVKNELTSEGIIVESAIKKINDTYTTLAIRPYVIMPNHVHMIVELIEGDHRTNLSSIIGFMKKLCNQKLGNNIWQKSFYDHIIQDDTDYENHCVYIEENSKKWLMGKDEYYNGI